MALKRTFVVFVFVLVVALLAACVRSASTPPVSVVTPPESAPPAETSGAETKGETLPTEVQPAEVQPAEGQPEAPASGAAPTNEVLAQLEVFVTQTAAAALMAGGQPPAEAPGVGSPAPGAEQPGALPTASGPSSADQPTAEPVQAAQATPTSESAQTQPQPTQQPTAAAQAQPQPAQQQPPPAGQIITATPGIPSTYTVQTSEFIYCIARRFDINPYELMSINGLSQNSILKAGMVLKIPKTGHDFPGARALRDHPTTYIVEGGESIYAIACKFGDVSPDMIALANQLKSPFTLSAGQELYIP